MLDHNELCLYCGEEYGSLPENIIPSNFEGRDGFQYQCFRCGARGPWDRTKAEALGSFEYPSSWENPRMILAGKFGVPLPNPEDA